ncbi:hypothetical protein [Bacteroides faecium]|uniref:Uncharacterized protein n=1 Tax=Bacteroides faecium TaxID=2715212 RepID=A0A6H0KNI8_9BACE|nr:hypothetical protein [Bacteroides faecium]QIU94769.1 hypothetical protein BacF7301_11725 [Bacteroides faecium]
MGGEGYMLDMIRRLSEGREASRLRRERTNERLKHMNQAGEHSSLPDTTPEEMEHIIKDSEKKKEKDSNYFVWGTLIIMGILVAIAVTLWAVFIK